MRPAAVAASADGNGLDSHGERNIRSRRRAFHAGLIADKLVSSAERSQERRIRRQFTARTTPQQFDLPFQLALRTIARGLHLVAHACDDALAKGGFEACELVLDLLTNVDFKARFMGNV